MGKTVYTPEFLEALKRDYPYFQSNELAKRFGCPIHTIYNAAFKLGLKKDPDLIRKMSVENMKNPNHPARKHWIKNGTPPHNKGKKQTEYMSKEAFERSKATRFKKGHIPKTALFDNAITKRRDSSGRYYLCIRVSPGKWVQYHRYIWEKANGIIPDGHNVQFKDRNTLNCSIDNLYMISRSDQMKHENSVHASHPVELRKITQLMGALKRQINKVTKK